MLKVVVFSMFLLLYVNFSHTWLIADIKSISTNLITSESGKLSDGKPLILTPYLKNDKISDARKASLVSPLLKNTSDSYSGYFTVNEEYESNMFFWYFPAEKSPETAPVVLWLQGGPGGSSLYGLFYENGIYDLDEGGNLSKRDIYWSKTMHLIYIDNPVGTGFSFTRDTMGLSKDEISIGKNLYETLQQFFTMFPNLRENDFFISGESYAGKYIPALGYTIHRNNPTEKYKINFKGLAIGNGLVDPVNQLDYGSFLLGVGLIDENQKTKYDETQSDIREKINKKYWNDAFVNYSAILFGKESLLRKTSGFSYVYNYLISEGTEVRSEIIGLFSSSNIRKKIHVGNQSFTLISSQVYYKLIPDFMKSVAPWLSTLANNYRVLTYNGQLDITIPYPLTYNFMTKLNWCGKNALISAERKKWKVEETVAGYITTSAPSTCNGSVSVALVRDAGHSVPTDQPLWTYNLINSFAHNTLK